MRRGCSEANVVAGGDFRIEADMAAKTNVKR
jgi:hypothetical protein